MLPEWMATTSDPRAVALRDDNASALAELLASGAAKTGDRFHADESLLHVSAQTGAIKCTRLLLERGADLEARDDAGDSPLFNALEWGRTEIARVFLSQRARLHYTHVPRDDPATRAKYETQMAEHFAKMAPEAAKLMDQIQAQISEEDVELAAFLSESGAQSLRELIPINPGEMAKMLTEVSFKPSEKHAIHYCQDLACLKLLVDEYASPINVIAPDGEWPLKSFAYEGDAEAVEFLLSRGADPQLTSTGETALHSAVRSGNPQCIKLLLDAGANVNQEDVDGWVPVRYVQNAASLDLLLGAGADVNICDICCGLPSKNIKDPVLKARVRALERRG